MRRLHLPLILLLLAFTPACEPDVETEVETDPYAEQTGDLADDQGYDFNEWDADGTGYVEEQEIANFEYLSEMYASWEADGAGITSEEFATGSYDFWDLDEDDVLDEEEWHAFSTEWGDGSEIGTFSEWDTDASGTLSEEEFAQNRYVDDIYGAWDVDQSGVIDEDEFGDAFYSDWDTDGNGALDRSEWDGAMQGAS